MGGEVGVGVRWWQRPRAWCGLSLLLHSSPPPHVYHTKQFLAKTGTKSLEVKEKGLDKACGDLLRKLCEKYDNLLEVDKLAAVMNKVDSVKLVLQENVQVALANCVTLENIEKAAGTLPTRAFVHRDPSSIHPPI